MEGEKSFFFRRIVALYLKAGKKKKTTTKKNPMDLQHRGMELQEKDYKDGSGMR